MTGPDGTRGDGLQFLNGYKTILGLVFTGLGLAIPHLAPRLAEAAPNVFTIIDGIGGTLFALGIIHKAEKIRF